MKRVALLMESSLEVSREILAGIIGYCRAHDPWQLDFTPGGIGDQRLPRDWEGDGIIARIPNAREAARLAAHPAPKVLFDPLDAFIAPGQPLAACVRVENDHRAVGRAAADYFLARGRQLVDACQTAGVSVPYAAAVLAVNDDDTLCETCLPPLSSIRLDARQAGSRAAAALDALMAGRRVAHRRITYPPAQVVTRASTLQMQTDDALVIAVLERIRAADGFSLRAQELANDAHVTLKTLERRFHAALGRSVGSVVRATCLDSVRRLVETTDLSFAEITRRAGQLSASHLAAAFRARFGHTMSEARRRTSRTRIPPR